MQTATARHQAHAMKDLEGLPAWAWPILSLFYAIAWLVFLQPSQILWFLPAGLRLAALWVLPGKRWGWLLLAEALVACYLLWRFADDRPDINFIALSFAPLLIYALALYLIRGPEPGPALHNPRNMLLLLGCGVLSALLVSPILIFFDNAPAFVMVNFDPGTWGSIFAFVYGDLIGQLILAPLLILAVSRFRSSLRQAMLWASVLFAGATTSLVLILLHYHHELAPFLLLLVFAPMFMVAFLKGWTGAAMSVALTGVLLEIYLHFNPLPLDLIVLQLAFALISAGSLILGAAMTALRESHLHLQQQHGQMARVNLQLVETGDELRHVSQRLVRLEEQGQRELADELDVELGQSLHTLGTHIGMAVRSVKEHEALRTLLSIRDKSREMEDSLRRVLRQLRPKALDNKGLREAIDNGPLHEILDDAGIVLESCFSGDLSRLHEDEKTAIYRISQTVTRQAIGLNGIKTLKISVQIAAGGQAGDEVFLDIEMRPVQTAQVSIRGMYLKSVQDRVLALNGDYEVQHGDDSLLHRIVFQQEGALPDELVE